MTRFLFFKSLTEHTEFKRFLRVFCAFVRDEKLCEPQKRFLLKNLFSLLLADIFRLPETVCNNKKYEQNDESFCRKMARYILDEEAKNRNKTFYEKMT